MSLVPLTTNRLRLRALTAADHNQVFGVLGDEETPLGSRGASQTRILPGDGWIGA